MLRLRVWIVLLSVGLLTPATPTFSAPVNAQLPSELATPLFGLPFADPPGPSTWLVIQMYGNTVGAYRWRRIVYGAGQGLHFGIDFAARCGTPVVAIGDGVVRDVDNLARGALPHNLLINLGENYTALYGHLLERPRLSPGQKVQRGQVVGLVGDPDETCTSRPHLHLEIRDRQTLAQAYNPAVLIDADWDMLTLVGAFSEGFERDLDNPRQWQFYDDQPTVTFGRPLYNDYVHPWPPAWGEQ